MVLVFAEHAPHVPFVFLSKTSVVMVLLSFFFFFWYLRHLLFSSLEIMGVGEVSFFLVFSPEAGLPPLLPRFA